MRKAGWGVIHEPAARATHLRGATANTYKAGARIEFYRSRYLFFEKHYGVVAKRFLKAVMTANLTLNAIALGFANALTLGKSRSIAGNFSRAHRPVEMAPPGMPHRSGIAQRLARTNLHAPEGHNEA